AANGNGDRQHQREAEHTAEKERKEAFVIVEDERRRIEPALLTLKEAHRNHRAERHDEEHDQHRGWKEQRPVVADRLWRLASHCFSTTQSSLVILTPTLWPTVSIGRSRGVDTATICLSPASTKVSIVPPRSRMKLTVPVIVPAPGAVRWTSSGRIDNITLA